MSDRVDFPFHRMSKLQSRTRMQELTWEEMKVYHALAGISGEGDLASIGWTEIKKITKLSRSAVYRGRNGLKSRGLIKWTKRANRTLYWLPALSGDEEPAPTARTGRPKVSQVREEVFPPVGTEGDSGEETKSPILMKTVKNSSSSVDPGSKITKAPLPLQGTGGGVRGGGPTSPKIEQPGRAGSPSAGPPPPRQESRTAPPSPARECSDLVAVAYQKLAELEPEVVDRALAAKHLDRQQWEIVNSARTLCAWTVGQPPHLVDMITIRRTYHNSFDAVNAKRHGSSPVTKGNASRERLEASGSEDFVIKRRR